MISHLSGTLIQAWPTQVIVETGGIGYEVSIPLSSFDSLPKPPAPVHILTHLVVREDSHQLYGFLTVEERDLFRMLITKVSGIGPKTAMDVLGGISVAEFKTAVIHQDITRLSTVKGIGKKTAGRIVLELKDKIGIAGVWEAASGKQALSAEDRCVNDAVLALISLGYKQAEALKSVRSVLDRSEQPLPVEMLVHQALKQI